MSSIYSVQTEYQQADAICLTRAWRAEGCDDAGEAESQPEAVARVFRGMSDYRKLSTIIDTGPTVVHNQNNEEKVLQCPIWVILLFVLL